MSKYGKGDIMVNMEYNLKELADIKLKVDYYTKLYDQKTNELKAKMIQEKIKIIKDEDLSIHLKTTHRRNFNVEQVRNILGESAKQCIIETVKADKFDKVTKGLITEEKISQCYTNTEVRSLTWEGLEAYGTTKQ